MQAIFITYTLYFTISKGVLLHWSTIVSTELYRTSSEDNKPVLIKNFYDAVADNSYYDNKGELKEGVTYTYTLKPFNTYKGVKYYGTESTLTLEYHEDDPVVENCDEPRINAVTFQDNILYLSTYNSPQHTLGRIYASDDNGETWFTTCNFFTGNTEYTYWSQNINLEPERKYLFRYKFYEHDYLFGLYRTASKYSNIVSVTTPRNPVKPQLSIKSSAGTLPELSWTGESVENGYYTVYRRNQGSGFWVTIATEMKSYQYTDTTADKDKVYYYKVVYTNPSPEFIIESDSNLTTVVRNLNSEDSNSVSFRTDKIIKDICTADFSEVKDIVYSDNMTLPEITVTYKGIKLQENVDYIVSSSNYDKAGRAKIVISGIGEYSGEKAVYYNITLPETEKPLTCTVKYLDYDGTAISTQNVQPHSDSVVPPAPLRSGYIFVGWSHNGKNITADTDIKAKYKKSDSKLYTVTFVDRENNVISSQKVAFGESANAPQAPEFEGYKFDSWSGNYTSVSNNMLVKAKYKATSFESGTGIEDNPYIIASQEQLDYFSYVINNKNAEYSTACYKLANDIYYNDITSFESWSQNAVTGVMYYPENIWEPAGIKSENSSYSNSFKGKFDGNGYAIYGLYVNTKKDYVGFIGSAENAVITDLGIEKSFFATKGDYAGALVGLFSSMTTESEIYCCYGKDNYIKANGNAGGFAGQIMSISSRSAITITNCYSTDSYLEITDDLYLGGFSGFIRSNGTINIERCYTNNVLATEAPNPKLGLFSGDISKSDSATIMIGFSYCFQTMILDNYYSQYPPLGTPIDTVVISQVSLDYFNDKNCLLELKDYTTKENLRYDKNAVWVFSENDFPRLYTEGGKYTIEMHLGSKPFYVAFLREGDKVKVPFVNVDYGYTATGWTGEIPETMPANDILLFNHVQENSYTVDFYVDDIFVESKTYYQNDEIEIPMAPDGGKEIIWRDLPPVMPNENIKVYGYTPTLGDVNCDGDINILDVIIAMKGVVDLSVLDSAQKVNADVNIDGVLNVVDVIMIQKFIIGEISSLQ
ncbi:MAG: dockerin type I repeat-containing protein [Acutalibacteraceae bacterium]|nr:dockerin type I repeat-containing protein [Acutalibacteraceae bacterium]